MGDIHSNNDYSLEEKEMYLLFCDWRIEHDNFRTYYYPPTHTTKLSVHRIIVTQLLDSAFEYQKKLDEIII